MVSWFLQELQIRAGAPGRPPSPPRPPSLGQPLIKVPLLFHGRGKSGGQPRTIIPSSKESIGGGGGGGLLFF